MSLRRNSTFEQSVDQAFSNFGQELGASFRQAGIGFAASFLSAELAESLDINDDGFGGQLFTYTASQAVSSVLDYALDNVAHGIDVANAGFGGGLFYGLDGVGQGGPFVIPNPAVFIGSYLGHQIVQAENLGGAACAGPRSGGGAIGSTLVFWIKRLIPGEGRQALVNPEHKRETWLGFRADAWVPSVRVRTLGAIIGGSTAVAGAAACPGPRSGVVSTLVVADQRRISGMLKLDAANDNHSMPVQLAA